MVGQRLAVDVGEEEHLPGEFDDVAGDGVGGLMPEDAPPAGGQVDEQTRLEPGVVDDDVRPLEDLLAGMSEVDRAPMLLPQHGIAGPQEEVGGSDPVEAIGREVGRETGVGAVDAHPHLRGGGEGIDLDPIDGERDRSEPVLPGDLLVVAVASAVETVERLSERGPLRTHL